MALTLPDWTCRICGSGISISGEDDGWPTLADSQDFLREHARCLAAADAENVRLAYRAEHAGRAG